MEKTYEVTYKDGKKEVLDIFNIPHFSPMFNKMVRELNIGEEMYDMDSMTTLKRIS